MQKKDIEKILLSINPNIKKYLKKKINLVDNAILDSFDIMSFLILIEKKKKKKIKFSKVTREVFSDIDKITKFINKI